MINIWIDTNVDSDVDDLFAVVFGLGRRNLVVRSISTVGAMSL